MPAYSTVYRALKGLSAHESEVTLTHGRNPTKWGMIQFDNVQNYLRQRDARIGRENKMNVGMAAIYVELEGVDLAASDLDDKRKLLAENRRAEVNVEQLLGMIDQPHLETISILQWLRVLTQYIPELAKWKSQVSLLYRTRAAKLPMPPHATKVHPLATSGKNEQVTTELKDGLVDFLGQAGQSSDNYNRRLMLVGGDGLTYERLHQLKNYMQFHSDPFKSLEIVQPVLAAWHTEWTDVSRIYETHFGSTNSIDPSTLGHSAAVIGRSAPPNLKKVDYYPGVELMNLVLDVRMLDCWR
jgi:Family of unknown function (DUF6589)